MSSLRPCQLTYSLGLLCTAITRIALWGTDILARSLFLTHPIQPRLLADVPDQRSSSTDACTTDPRIRRLARTESEESLSSSIFVGNIDKLFDDAGENSPTQKPAKISDLSKNGVYTPPTKKLEKVHYVPDNTSADINHTFHTLAM
ncbi:hypothetical protein PENSUB_13706 [Penicillium subrubescens]|uniref:Uncharacterized protein n=1 Tax=Penicillium subrubescens TaxID=1316194 RepID=A0A1Q5SNU9_9EURO|nr:hypothetical protein PENSUB_13706 [Penicillium subrubescens]